jgi:Flp pilus assembly pilin Flp
MVCESQPKRTARLTRKSNTYPLEGQTMIKFIKNFRKDEAGAVTVDWVVLTAAVVGLAVAAYTSIEGGATNLTSNTATFMSTIDPGL